MKYEELTRKQRNQIKKIIGRCEYCGATENLQIHRINRGWNGGKYTLRNIYVLCPKCHRMFHEMELV